MLNLTDTPPKDPRGNSLELKRCPTMRPFQGIILSDGLIGTNTHYYKGRTIPCDSEGCPACGDGLPWRWHCWVPLFSPSTQVSVLFEMTARCAETCQAYRETYGSLRGAWMKAQRANSSPNSKVHLSLTPADLREIKLPECPDVLGALSIIWNIERPSMSVAGLLKDVPRLNVSQNPAQQQPAFPLNESTPPNSRSNGQPS